MRVEQILSWAFPFLAPFGAYSSYGQYYSGLHLSCESNLYASGGLGLVQALLRQTTLLKDGKRSGLNFVDRAMK